MRRSISSILQGVVTRTRNVSEYMLVLALCLVNHLIVLRFRRDECLLANLAAQSTDQDVTARRL